MTEWVAVAAAAAAATWGKVGGIGDSFAVCLLFWCGSWGKVGGMGDFDVDLYWLGEDCL